MPRSDAGIPRHEIGSFKLRNLKKICAAAVLALTISSATVAAENGHKVLGFIEFGKTTIPEAAALLKDKCQLFYNSDDTLVVKEPNCFPALKYLENPAELGIGAVLPGEKVPSPSAVVIDAYTNTNIIERVSIYFSVTDNSRRCVIPFTDALGDLLDFNYGIRTIDDKWRTDDYIVSIEQSVDRETKKLKAIYLSYRSVYTGNPEWLLTSPVYTFKNEQERKKYEDRLRKIKELSDLL